MLIDILGKSQFLGIVIIIPITAVMLTISIERLMKDKQRKNLFLNVVALLFAFMSLIFISVCWETFVVDNTIFPISDVNLNLRADLTSLCMMTTFALVFFTVIVYSMNFMKDDDTLSFFYALLFCLFTGINAVVVVKDFFSLFMAWELMALAGYSLVVYYRNKESFEAGFKYLVMSSFGSLSLLYGVAILHGLSGTLIFTDIPSLPQSLLLYGSIICMIVGFGITAAAFMLNTWLPDAHPAAPAPVSVLLSGIIVTAGVYGILRVFEYVLPNGFMSEVYQNSGWSRILIVIGVFTMFQGNIMVLAQFMRTDEEARNFKRILAFSTIGHMGFLIVGIGAGNVQGLAGTLFHILSHGLAKGLLFSIAGYLIFHTNSHSLDDYKGLGRKDSFLSVALIVGLFSLAAVPLFAGFWSKLYIIIGLFNNNDQYFGFLMGCLTLVNAVLAAAGYLWIIRYIVMDKPDEDSEITKIFKKREYFDSFFMKLSMGILISLIIIIGLFPTPFAELTIRAATELTT